MKMKKLLASALVLAMSTTLLAACGTKKPNEGGTDAGNDKGSVSLITDDRSAYKGTSDANAITVNISQEPPEMFSVAMTDTVSFSVLRHIVDNLVMLDENDQVIPGVAETWTESDDGLTYNFKLRQGMKWSNGEPVTAHDFIFAWTALLTPSYTADYAYFGYVFKNGEAFNKGEVGADQLGIKAISDYELEVVLENPTSYFIPTLAFGVFAPVNEKGYKEFGESYATDASKIVTNGPFKMTTWDHESKIVLEKNADYFDADKIALDKITMVMINDTNSALNSFKAGEVDVIGLNGDQTKAMKAEKYPVFAYDDGSTFYLEYNLENEFLKNDNLRKAITYAIDKQAFVDAIVKNDSKAAVGFTSPAINGMAAKFSDEVGATVPVVNVEKAKEYYAKALEELGVDKLQLTMISDDGDTAVKNASFVQEQLRVNLDLDINVETMPFKSRLERMSNKDFALVFAGWGPDYNDPMTFLDLFETGNGNNHTSYSNAAYDDLLNKIRKETDTTKRFGYLEEIETILMEDLPIGPIYWRSRNYVLSGKIESGVIRTAFQDMNYRFTKLAK